MYNFVNCRNYIIIKDKKELDKAKQCDVCRFIIYEDGNIMNIWTKVNGKWERERYILYGEDRGDDLETTGLEAYMRFYDYCGKDEVEKMKHILNPISMWESFEQLHYANYEYAEKKIYQPIYEFDANSAFTFGAMQLPEGFDMLKKYMMLLYDKKKNTTNKSIRSRYKNLQNYLVGYFARIKEFIRVRSDIIMQSNFNIKAKMAEITQHNGKVFLSNTDSIVTDEIGAEIMDKYKGDNVGEFKLSTYTDRLFYKSPNAYQLGEKVVYSGIKYFSKKHIDFFNDLVAFQIGSLVEGYNFLLYESENETYKICNVRYGEVLVIQTNLLGEEVKRFRYRTKE